MVYFKGIQAFQILLMVQKSGVHQLKLVVYPIIYRLWDTSQVVVWDFFHQQYVYSVTFPETNRKAKGAGKLAFRATKGESKVFQPSTIYFQVRFLSFREGKKFGNPVTCCLGPICFVHQKLYA